jgi:hypothetical protein
MLVKCLKWKVSPNLKVQIRIRFSRKRKKKNSLMNLMMTHMFLQMRNFNKKIILMLNLMLK